VPLIAAPPDTFALFLRSEHPDLTLQQWNVETVVAFDAADGGAYIVGGKNMTGTLVRLDEVLREGGFKLAAMWEQQAGGKDAAKEWAGRHIKLLYEDALPFDPNDPRSSV
jgi:hypothetical protein